MDKAFADEMIGKYQKKFFGFAVSKCNDFNEAEELASRITCEAYKTMLVVENVYNWEGYLYRIAYNVYVHYVKEQHGNRAENITDALIADSYDFVKEYTKNEDFSLLRREIAWLTKRHREIVLLHYYHNKKIAEIAQMLELPEGTVKWHLSDAKSQLREGMTQMRRKGNLGIEPVKLGGFGNIGTPGELGDTEYFLNSKLKQNIAFAVYYEPKTIEEIAEELNVSPVFVEDEVEYLTEYGFLDLLPGQRYRANIFIDNVPGEVYEKCLEISKEIAVEVCDEYIPLLLEANEVWGETVYVPDDDKNYWYWSKIVQGIMGIGLSELDMDDLKKHNYYVKRKDGGEYAAIAVVKRDDRIRYQRETDYVCGPMWRVRENDKIGSWSLSTAYDDREFGWEDNKESDMKILRMYLDGQLPKTEALVEKYKRLYDRGYLVNRDGKDKINVIMIEDAPNYEMLLRVNSNRIPVTEELKAKIEEGVKRKISLEKPYYPGHMHEMLKIIHQMKKVEPMLVVEELLHRGVLKPLSEEQRKGVMTIVYCDKLPAKQE